MWCLMNINCAVKFKKYEIKWLFLRNQDEFSCSYLILMKEKTEKDDFHTLYHVTIKVMKQCWVLGEDMYHKVITVGVK